LGEAHSLWQDDTETIEESGLCRVWLGHAAQANLTMRCGRQNDVLGLNTFEFFQDDARRITETCAALPHLQALPQHEGKKADEDEQLRQLVVSNVSLSDIAEDLGRTASAVRARAHAIRIALRRSRFIVKTKAK
ncbi:MAG TPA: hypothetical protein VK561_00645, partial [Bradyrhizobium sp.]|nr:hypothetical protein [Bradyrhizobium sp.]